MPSKFDRATQMSTMTTTNETNRSATRGIFPRCDLVRPKAIPCALPLPLCERGAPFTSFFRPSVSNMSRPLSAIWLRGIRIVDARYVQRPDELF